LVAVTVALGIAAPVGSVTVPVMEPKVLCPLLVPTKNASKHSPAIARENADVARNEWLIMLPLNQDSSFAP
jgi:hypothetical protein